LGILYAGGKGYFLSPISFLKDPLIWIRTLSKYGGTHSPSPNFAYALVVRKLKERANDPQNQNLQLHSAVSLINAAEPVDYRAIRDFYDAFSRFGLPGNCVHPTYGLAEHTVFVCSKGMVVLTVRKSALEQGRVDIVHENMLRYENGKMEGESDEINAQIDGSDESHDLQRLVGCGYPGRVEGVTVKIIHPETYIEIPAFEVGEVWVSSASKALGYWNHPELSHDDFEAEIVLSEGQIREDYHEKRYLRTGDMGFVYKDELFICGRLKDMIIVGGANHYPQDIEHTVEQSLSEYLRPGCSAAFAMTAHSRHNIEHNSGDGSTEEANRGTEEVVYVAELKDVPSVNKKELYTTIVRRCREVVASEHGLSLRTVCLLTPRSIPKTTSGKIARSWCRRGLMEGTLSILHRSDSNKHHIHPHVHSHHEDASASSTGSTATAGASSKPGYNAAHTEEESKQSKPETKPAHISLGSSLSESEIRSLSIPEVKSRIESSLCAISQSSPTHLTAPINPSRSLVELGLDSMTIVQFNGILENRFHCVLKDEFLFTNMATLVELSIAAQHGSLTDEQERRFEIAGPAVGGNAHTTARTGAGKQAAAVVGTTSCGIRRGRSSRQLLCPWFTCCY
jgi:acyl-CoA synthetase (AMP-forming)/AMP-acid ligase II/acyl carrier protein